VTRRVFHDEGPLEPERVVALAPEEAHYLVRVRRALVGDAVEVLDGRGAHVRGEITSASGNRCEVRLLAPIPAVVYPPLVLMLGLPEAKAALEAITLATEVGATTIVLVRCARSQPGEPSPARIDRTIRAALRQCGRALPPAIVGPLDLAAALARADLRPDPAACWVAVTEGADASGPAEPLGSEAGATILVGPEGGLTAAEVQAAHAAGLRPVSLGPFVLRTPTAVCAALARAIALGPRPATAW
jgi:16S rRNA (uracil1498-N3)-methyltransferase